MARIEAADVRRSEQPLSANRRRGLVGPTIATAVCLSILLSLGVWQIRRLAWKEALLAQIHSRLLAPPAPLPPELSWRGLIPDDYEYRHVVAHGTYENDKEVQILDAGGDAGPGYLVLTPLQLDDGSLVIVDRGFVLEKLKDPSTRPNAQISGPTVVKGVMRSPQLRNLFTPADNPAQGAWFTRDPEEIADFYHLSRVAPFTIDADPTPNPPGAGPTGGATELDIPNNHLSYAITWFGLAATLLGVYGVFAWRRLHD